jgi:hypothetical protein
MSKTSVISGKTNLDIVSRMQKQGYTYSAAKRLVSTFSQKEAELFSKVSWPSAGDYLIQDLGKSFQVFRLTSLASLPVGIFSSTQEALNSIRPKINSTVSVFATSPTGMTLVQKGIGVKNNPIAKENMEKILQAQVSRKDVSQISPGDVVISSTTAGFSVKKVKSSTSHQLINSYVHYDDAISQAEAAAGDSAIWLDAGKDLRLVSASVKISQAREVKNEPEGWKVRGVREKIWMGDISYSDAKNELSLMYSKYGWDTYDAIQEANRIVNYWMKDDEKRRYAGQVDTGFQFDEMQKFAVENLIERTPDAMVAEDEFGVFSNADGVVTEVILVDSEDDPDSETSLELLEMPEFSEGSVILLVLPELEDNLIDEAETVADVSLLSDDSEEEVEHVVVLSKSKNISASAKISRIKMKVSSKGNSKFMKLFKSAVNFKLVKEGLL